MISPKALRGTRQIYYLGMSHTGIGISPPETFSGFSSFLLPPKRVESSPGPSSFPPLSFMSVSSSPLCLKVHTCCPSAFTFTLSQNGASFIYWRCGRVKRRARAPARAWHGTLTFTQPLLNQQEWRHADLLLQVSDDWKNGSFYSNSQFAVLYLEHRICNITDPLMSEYHSLT